MTSKICGQFASENEPGGPLKTNKQHDIVLTLFQNIQQSSLDRKFPLSCLMVQKVFFPYWSVFPQDIFKSMEIHATLVSYRPGFEQSGTAKSGWFREYSYCSRERVYHAGKTIFT